MCELEGVAEELLLCVGQVRLNPLQHGRPVFVREAGNDHLVNVDVGDVGKVVHVTEEAVRVGAALVDGASAKTTTITLTTIVCLVVCWFIRSVYSSSSKFEAPVFPSFLYIISMVSKNPNNILLWFQLSSFWPIFYFHFWHIMKF